MAKITEQDIKALAELKARLSTKTIEDMMEDFMRENPYGDSRELAEYMHKQGKSDMLNTLSEEIGKMADKYKEKLLSAESRDICTESRWSELNTILAMITGFKNSL